MNVSLNLSLLEPMLVTEQFIQPFKFWEDGVQEGMMFQDELFRHYEDFQLGERYIAFDLAHSIADNNRIQVIISTHADGYRIWGSLRCCNG